MSGHVKEIEADSLHQPWLNGMDLLQDAQRDKIVLSTGIEGIDLLLQGGLRRGQLTELVGPSPSGKTQVCLHAAAHVACEYMSTVMFLDTCNSFSSKRIAHFVSRTRSPLGKEVQNEDSKIHLLIVDSFSSLITPVLSGKGTHGRSVMVSAGFLLKKLAHAHNLAVLVTNHTVSGEGGVSKPALGESWKNVPHARLLLSHDHGSNFYNISIVKHTCMASGQSRRFIMSD